MPLLGTFPARGIAKGSVRECSGKRAQAYYSRQGALHLLCNVTSYPTKRLHDSEPPGGPATGQAWFKGEQTADRSLELELS